MTPSLPPESATVERLLGTLSGEPTESSTASLASREAAVAELTTILYDDLRRLAASYLRRERSGHSFAPTDLVHEAYGRLVDQERVDWKGRTHFLGIAAQAMRRILVDRARRRHADKRGGQWKRVTLSGVGFEGRPDEVDEEQLLALDSAMLRLAELDERQAKIVEMRYFGGMSVPEVAEALGVGARTVDREWAHARSWLKRELATR
jgi:RNA polymerase sigma factor (TIGR02999 family)